MTHEGGGGNSTGGSGCDSGEDWKKDDFLEWKRSEGYTPEQSLEAWERYKNGPLYLFVVIIILILVYGFFLWLGSGGLARLLR